jgi:signal transduction histidine kinase
MACSYSDDGSEKPLSETMRAVVYRMARELLINAVKNSAAESIAMRSWRVDGQMAVEVRDDGRGFDVSAGGAGFGLRNVAEQLRGLGGRLQLESRPGSGTVACLWVPLDPED